MSSLMTWWKRMFSGTEQPNTLESNNQAQRSVMLGKRPLLDGTVKYISEKKQRWVDVEDLKPEAGPSPASYLTDSDPDMTSTQENRTQDAWLQEICQSQGDYEQEVMSCDEADLYTRYKRCTKNPRHEQFIAVNTFRSEHLPERYRSDQNLTDLVKAQADVTCLIKVSYVSPDRPETSPFYKYRNKSHFSRSGTGWVSHVRVYTEEEKGYSGYRPCQCQTCQGSGEPRSEWAVVKICTANHLVFDKREAEACKCYFFYDNPQQKLTDCPLLAATHLHQVSSHNDDDVSQIEYYIHDLEWASVLDEMHNRYLSLCINMKNTYGSISQSVTNTASCEMNKYENTQALLLSCKDKDTHFRQGNDYNKENGDDEEYVDNTSESDDEESFLPTNERYNPEHDLVIITSHPHGCSKMVTVGQVTHRHTMLKFTSYEYSTVTCPGSSGAPVFVLGRGVGWTCHPHSGSVRDQGLQQINHSGFWWHWL